MDDGLTGDLLRLTGLMAWGVSLAWLVQIFLFPAHSGSTVPLLWLLGAAAIGGAGTSALLAGTAMVRQTADA
jgi:hypothetical protein